MIPFYMCTQSCRPADRESILFIRPYLPSYLHTFRVAFTLPNLRRSCAFSISPSPPPPRQARQGARADTCAGRSAKTMPAPARGWAHPLLRSGAGAVLRPEQGGRVRPRERAANVSERFREERRRNLKSPAETFASIRTTHWCMRRCRSSDQQNRSKDLEGRDAFLSLSLPFFQT